jgi:hypothetical protein
MEQHFRDSYVGSWSFAQSCQDDVPIEDYQEGSQKWQSSVSRHQRSSQKHTVGNLMALIPNTNHCMIKWGQHGITQNVFVPKLRSYPIAFGLRVIRFLPKLRHGASGRPPLAEEDAVEMFRAMPDDDRWSEANIIEAVQYVRGSTHLRLTDRWRHVFPQEL